MKIKKFVFDEFSSINGISICREKDIVYICGQGNEVAGLLSYFTLGEVMQSFEKSEKIQFIRYKEVPLSVNISPVGSFLAMSMSDGSIYVYDIKDESGEIAQITRQIIHKTQIIDFSWSPFGKLIASGSVDATIAISKFEANHIVKIHELSEHSGPIKGIAWSHGGTYLATQSEDKSVIIWDAINWTILKKIIEPLKDSSVFCNFSRPSWNSNDSQIIIPHAFNNSIPVSQVFNIKGMSLGSYLIGHKSSSTAVKFSDNLASSITKGHPYNLCAIYSKDHSLSIWSSEKKRPIIVIKNIFLGSISEIEWSKDCKYLVLVSEDSSFAIIYIDEQDYLKFSKFKQKLLPNSEISTRNIETFENGTKKLYKREENEKNVAKKDEIKTKLLNDIGPLFNDLNNIAKKDKSMTKKVTGDEKESNSKISTMIKVPTMHSLKPFKSKFCKKSYYELENLQERSNISKFKDSIIQWTCAIRARVNIFFESEENIILACNDNSLHIISSSTGVYRCLHWIMQSECSFMSSQGDLLVIVSSEGLLYFWNLKTFKCILQSIYLPNSITADIQNFNIIQMEHNVLIIASEKNTFAFDFDLFVWYLF
ncbi:MAG: hypothetical protein MHMPM18_002378 [Marteilia pararefringens]